MINKLRLLFVKKFIDPYIWFCAYDSPYLNGMSIDLMWKRIKICTFNYSRYELLDRLRGDIDNGTRT